MKNKLQKIDEIEKYLLHSKKAFDEGMNNLPKFIKDKNLYRQILQKIDADSYIQRGDLHYFVSRVLLKNLIVEYGYFAGQQCIENYLKGYLKEITHNSPPQTHNLNDLLNESQRVTLDNDSFLNSDYIKVIVIKFNPFYEYARYPAQISRPDGGYVMIPHFDLEILDYFIYQMRKIIKPSINSWDILSKGHFHLELCKEMRPEFYKMFLEDNLNFSNS